jgi:UPF0716 protein FxsA
MACRYVAACNLLFAAMTTLDHWLFELNRASTRDMRRLLLATIVLLSTELWLFLWLTRQIGWWPMLGIAMFGGLLGASLAKRQGRQVFREWQAAFGSGQAPAVGALEGTLVFVSAALFLLPGVLTDVLAFALLFAPVRQRVARYLRPRLGLDAWTRGFTQRTAPRPGHGRQVLDTEGEAVPDADEEPVGPPQLR